MNAKKSSTIFWDFIFFLNAILIRFFTFVANPGKIDGAMICDLRSRQKGEPSSDPSRFGYNIKKFKVLPWIKYRRENMRFQLFMIGVESWELKSTDGLRRAQEFFVLAVRMAVKRGAKVILLAANTKHIFGRDNIAMERLSKEFPGIIFTLGDNLTAGFINERIEKSAISNNVNKYDDSILIVAPRGILGLSTVRFANDYGFENVYGLFNPNDGMKAARNFILEKGINISPVVQFNDLPCKIRMVVTCGFDEYYKLTPEIIRKIKPVDKKLIIIDPSEPSNLSQEVLVECKDEVIYFKAGNGWNPDVRYVLGKWAAWVLDMKENLFWGCFSETMTLAYALREYAGLLEDNEWFSVDPKKISFVRNLAQEIGFSLPPQK